MKKCTVFILILCLLESLWAGHCVVIVIICSPNCFRELQRLESVLKLELNKCHGKPDYTEQNSFCQLSRFNEWENKELFNFETNQNELLNYLAEVMHDHRKQCVVRWFIFTRIKTMDN